MVILITGASSGIGEALAHYYAKHGNHTLILIGRDKQRLESVTLSCQEMGSTVSSNTIDVCNAHKLSEWLTTENDKTPIDLVIANAGISAGTAGMDQSDLIPHIKQIYDVNITGALNTLEPILPSMIKRQSGQIAFVSSMASYAPWPGAPAYASSKTAIRFLGNSLRGTLSEHGIKVSVICPGFIKSRITDKNDFPMPFFKKAGYAAQKIAKGLEKNKTTIAFPFIMYTISSVIGLLPATVLIAVNNKMPKKKTL